MANVVVLVSSKETGSRSGKNSFADGMISSVVDNYSGIIINGFELSAPIKAICHHAFHLNREQMTTDLKDRPCGVKIKGVTDNASPRQLMQLIGTEIFRNTFDTDIWIDRCCEKIEMWFANPENYPYNMIAVITDVRFNNEVEKIRSKFENTLLVDIVRSNHKNVTSHLSDNGLDSSLVYDFIIQNDKTLEELYEKSGEILKFINNNFFDS